jgi:hypothetical protein
MSAPYPSRLGRGAVGLLALAVVALIVGWDLAQSCLPDPFSAPPPMAFGSGAAPGGAHCAAN